MNQAFCRTKIGTIKIEYNDNMLFFLKTVQEPFKKSIRTDFADKVFSELAEYLDGSRKSFDIPCALSGTDFQLRVWRELEKIPYGSTVTYKELAERIGNVKASRAAGSACGKNPIWIIVPCHRVIGSDGSLAGYAGGVDMKKRLLKIEADKIMGL